MTPEDPAVELLRLREWAARARATLCVLGRCPACVAGTLGPGNVCASCGERVAEPEGGGR